MRTLLSLSVLVVLAASQAPAVEVVYVPQGSTWKYLDDGSDQGTAWTLASFDDSGWAEGPAPLGYGDGIEATTVNCGACSCPCNPKYITTYFRHSFNVPDANEVLSLSLDLMRDDGAVVFLNGTEIHRSNMPGGPIDYLTLASSTVGGSSETSFESVPLNPNLVQTGDNLLAVEIHQRQESSSDIGFDFVLSTQEGTPGQPILLRGPYLQSGSPSSAVVRFRTDIFSAGRVNYGLAPGDLNEWVDGSEQLNHEIEITGLDPATRYYYSVEAGGNLLAGDDAEHYFETAPVHGTLQPTRI